MLELSIKLSMWLGIGLGMRAGHGAGHRAEYGVGHKAESGNRFRAGLGYVNGAKVVLGAKHGAENGTWRGDMAGHKNWAWGLV